MAQFLYHAVHKDSGAPVKGTMRAKARPDVIKQLLNDGYIATSIVQKQFSMFLPKDDNIKLAFQDKFSFTKHLATIVNAGITLVDGIDILLRQAKSSKLNRVLSKIFESVSSGQSLSKSVALFPRTFEPIYVKILELGESSGNLAKVLKYLEEQQAKSYALRKKMKGAMVYPIIIVSLVGIVGIGLITFIIPKIENIFSMFKVDLPLPTRILLYTNEFMRANYLYLILGLITALIAGKKLLELEQVKKVRDKIALRLPIIGGMLKYYNLALVSRMFTTLLRSGVSTVESMKIISNLVTNTSYKAKLTEAHQRIQAGAPLAEFLQSDEDLFPAFMTQMINIGEKTGTLEETMGHLADSYEEELDGKLKQMSTMIEPILLLVAGLAVGAIALSIILPIYQLPNLIK